VTIDHARDLAAQLVRALSPLSGDHDAVNAEMSRWLDVLDFRDLSVVCIAAVHLIFTDCLTPTPLHELPPDRLALLAPLPERKTA
jgi:hypothetical protein